MDEGAKKIILELEAFGYIAYVCGGAVRDLVMGREPHDWDIATNAAPGQVLQVFKLAKMIHTRTAYPVVDANGYQVATFRADTPGADRSDLESIKVGATMEEDAARRDLTVNALYLNANGDVLDPTGLGLKDIQDQVIRFVGDPDQRLQEDATRALRALRFATTLGFAIEEKSYQALQKFTLL